MNVINAIHMPLSDKNIINLLNNDCFILLYKDLNKYNNIDDLFNKSNNIIILYQTTCNYGHWVALINHNKYIEFFDSYGFFPEDPKQFMTKKWLVRSGQDNNYILYLLSTSNKKCIYNNKKMQDSRPYVATCGRHCVIRIKLKHMSLKKYQQLMLKNGEFNSDFLVTYFTINNNFISI